MKVLTSFISLDEALHYLSGDETYVQLGKLAIVKAILDAERSSRIRNVDQVGDLDATTVKGAWAYHFLSMALSGVRQEEVASVFENVTIVNFNYDRAFEHYLYWALLHYAALDRTSAAALVAKLRTLRPYGCIGPLDWQERAGTSFGKRNIATAKLFDLAGGIRTYTEQNQSDIPVKVNETIEEAHVIVILGFGFHDQNVQPLRPGGKRSRPRGRQAFATVKGIAHENHALLSAQLGSCFNTDKIRLLDKAASQMLYDLRPSILAAAGEPLPTFPPH